uniref:Uncharacterized protein n=1 Tax=viral metagenome TaxID=1070528 RepID=A0A6C0BUS4_9ZZZZ
MSLLKYVLIEKSGECVEKTSKNGLAVDELYKKCGFKKVDGFNESGKWRLNDGLDIIVYGRLDGKAGSENKFECPPPIDKQLFFGNMAVVAMLNGVHVDLDVNHWGEIYAELMGGFEDIDSEEEEEEELSEEEEDQKDDFIVEDEEQEISENENENEEQELTKEDYISEDDY